MCGVVVGSVVFVPACTRAALLPNDGILDATPRTAIQRARLRRVEPTEQPHDAPPVLPHQLHHQPPHRRLRPRLLLAPADVRGLPAGVPPLALRSLAPPLRRVSSPER